MAYAFVRRMWDPAPPGGPRQPSVSRKVYAVPYVLRFQPEFWGFTGASNSLSVDISVSDGCDAVKSMGPEELADFERRTFTAWDRASLGDLRRAIERRRKELTR